MGIYIANANYYRTLGKRITSGVSIFVLLIMVSAVSLTVGSAVTSDTQNGYPRSDWLASGIYLVYRAEYQFNTDKVNPIDWKFKYTIIDTDGNTKSELLWVNIPDNVPGGHNKLINSLLAHGGNILEGAPWYSKSRFEEIKQRTENNVIEEVVKIDNMTIPVYKVKMTHGLGDSSLVIDKHTGLIVNETYKTEQYTIEMNLLETNVDTELSSVLKSLSSLDQLKTKSVEAPHIIVHMKQKKGITLFSIRNDNDVPIYGIKLHVSQGSIKFVKAKGWDTEKVDSSTVMLKTGDRPIAAGKMMILLLSTDNPNASVEWSAFDNDMQVIRSGQGSSQNIPRTATFGLVGSAHEHAVLSVFINGKAIDFSQSKYQLKNRYIHFENSDGTVVHKHATGVDFGFLFETMGIQFTSDCFIMDDGTKYCNDGKNTLKFFVNDVQNYMYNNYVLKGGDRILINYSSEGSDEIGGLTSD